MPKRPPIARISITIPADLLKAADRLAEEHDRPRSWVFGEAVRRWMSGTATAPPVSGVVREVAALPYAASRPGLGESRLAQLRSDLAMTTEARVLAAEEATRVDHLLRPPLPGDRLRFFDRFEDYLAWKRQVGIGQ